jgi:hypothetical protein
MRVMIKTIGVLTLLLIANASASENGLGFVYLPLYDPQSGIRIERVSAILGHASPEQEISALGKPIVPVQTTSVPTENANLVVEFGLKLSCEQMRDGRYRVDFDVRDMRRPPGYSVTEDQVVEATLICLRLMFPAGDHPRIFIQITSTAAQRQRWQPFEQAFFRPRPDA